MKRCGFVFFLLFFLSGCTLHFVGAPTLTIKNNTSFSVVLDGWKLTSSAPQNKILPYGVLVLRPTGLMRDGHAHSMEIVATVGEYRSIRAAKRVWTFTDSYTVRHETWVIEIEYYRNSEHEGALRFQ